jgi:ureidoglycolate hydrolase
MGVYENIIWALLALARAKKAQGSMEYIMMLSAVSIIIVVALAMILQLKGVAVHAFTTSGNQGVVNSLDTELANLTNLTK